MRMSQHPRSVHNQFAELTSVTSTQTDRRTDYATYDSHISAVHAMRAKMGMCCKPINQSIGYLNQILPRGSLD